jgi:hypothetical protein
MKHVKYIAGILASLTLIACGGNTHNGCEVTYEVEGRNAQQRVLITMSPPAGKALQGEFQVYPEPHRETYHFNDGDFLYISGQNANSSNGAFDVRIIVNGEVKAKNDGFGYSVAVAKSTCQ